MLLTAFLGSWTLSALLEVRKDMTAARAALVEAREQGQLETLGPTLRQAQGDLQDSVTRLAQPGPALVASVPLLGRTVSAVDRTAEAALVLVRGTADAVDAASALRRTDAGSSVDLAAMAQVADALERAARSSRDPVDALLAQPLGMVPGPVSQPVTEAKNTFADAPDRFRSAAAGLRGLAGVLGAERPRNLLVVLENNAELRGTGGLVTVFAEATARDGQLAIGSFRDVDEVAAEPPGAVPVEAPDDYRALWGAFLANTTLWKNANMSPDVPTSSLVLSRVAAVSLPTAPDAVLWFDVPAIAAVLAATGPQQLPDGSTLSSENAVERLLSGAYEAAEDTREGQARRRETLRGAADAVLGAVLGQGAGPATSVGALAAALAEAAQGRHVAVWSAVAEEQADLRSAGLAGEVAADGGDLSSFVVQNLGGGDREGNKLDYYARRRVSVRAVVGPDWAEVEQLVVLRNTAPDGGLPVYVGGGGTPGATNNLVTLALPSAAQVTEFSRGGQVVLDAPRPSGDHAVVTDFVSLQPGTETSWLLRYRVPVAAEGYALSLVPQPLAFPAELEVELRPTDGVSLAALPGSDLVEGEDGSLRLSEAYDLERTLLVRAERDSAGERAVDRLRRFWNEPVSLP